MCACVRVCVYTFYYLLRSNRFDADNDMTCLRRMDGHEEESRRPHAHSNVAAVAAPHSPMRVRVCVCVGSSQPEQPALVSHNGTDNDQHGVRWIRQPTTKRDHHHHHQLSLNLCAACVRACVKSNRKVPVRLFTPELAANLPSASKSIQPPAQT